MNVKAIETRYAGHLFRSRLEARWAVFFDHAGIAWEYESEGYELSDGRRYLPDFRLPDCGTWVEVKGDPARVDVDLLTRAAADLPMYRGQGEEGPVILLLGPIPRSVPGVRDWGWFGVERTGAESPESARYGFGTYHKNRRPWWLDNAQYQGVTDLLEPAPDSYEWDDALPAYAAARSARFEHGQSGAV